jgi:hypothetical protein
LASEWTNPADNLTFEFKLPELWDNKCLLFKPPSWWYFVTVAQENQYTWLGPNSVHFVSPLDGKLLDNKNGVLYNFFISEVRVLTTTLPACEQCLMNEWMNKWMNEWMRW